MQKQQPNHQNNSSDETIPEADGWSPLQVFLIKVAAVAAAAVFVLVVSLNVVESFSISVP
jgi:hypothetical protein